MNDIKALDTLVLQHKSKSRAVLGLAAVHGVVDGVKDRSHPGAFAKSISAKRGRIVHLWNHDSKAPPIARIVRLEEIGRAQLPAAVKSAYPEATGALLVEREYLDTPRADEIYKGVLSGAIPSMSYMYTTIKNRRSKDGVNELAELDLHETSDVNFPCNPAAVSAFKANLQTVANWRQTQQRLKALEYMFRAAADLPKLTDPTLYRTMRDHILLTAKLEGVDLHALINLNRGAYDDDDDDY